MALAIIRKIDSLGRIVIPKDLREMLGVKAGDEIVITVGEGHIIISGKKKEGSPFYIFINIYKSTFTIPL